MADIAVTAVNGWKSDKKAEMRHSCVKAFKRSGPVALITAMFGIGAFLALGTDIPVKNVMKNYSYDVLAILIVMELFTNLIAETKIMQLWLSGSPIYQKAAKGCAL